MRGHGVKEQCVRGHFKEMATRARPYVTTATLGSMYGFGRLGAIFFSGAYTVSSCDIDTLLARSSGKWPRDSLGHMFGLRTRSQRHGQLKSCARAPSLG